MSTNDRPPSHGTAAYFRTLSDEQLDDVLRGGPRGNRSVEGALAEISRRSAARQEKWARRAFFAALAAAIVAAIGVAVTAVK